MNEDLALKRAVEMFRLDKLLPFDLVIQNGH